MVPGVVRVISRRFGCRKVLLRYLRARYLTETKRVMQFRTSAIAFNCHNWHLDKTQEEDCEGEQTLKFHKLNLFSGHVTN
jgi:hypothetical protein